MNKAFKAIVAGAVLALTSGGLALAAPAAHAAGWPVTTPIINDYATTGANPGKSTYQWANDNFSRALSFTQQDSSVCQSAFGSFGSGDLCYTATISDAGTFTTLVNALQPNGGTSGGTGHSGKTIQNVVSGHFTGSESWTIETAPTDVPDPTRVQTVTLNDSFNPDPAGLNPQDQTPNWYNQAFQTPLCKIYTSGSPCSGPGQVLLNKDWSWTYTTDCGESWTDAGSYGAGNNGFGGQSTPTSLVGNITGITNCAPDTVSVGNPGTQTTTANNFASLAINATTSNGDSITSYSASGLPSGLSINTSTGVISGTPTSSGASTVTVTANDSDESASTTFAWNVTLTLPPPVFSSYGNNVNPFGNGFDVFEQHASVNTPIVGWPATQHDPATHFLKEAEGAHFRFEYAPNGVGDGLCVSNPGNNALVLRGCNGNMWQQFDYAGGHIVSVVNGGIVNPDGTGNQLTVGPSATSWGGSHYTWTAFSSLPA